MTTQTNSLSPVLTSSSTAARSAAKSWPRVVRVLATDAMIALVAVLAVECLLQWQAPEYRGQYYDQTHTASHPIQMNDEGFRGQPVPLAKQPGEMRILALGDSVTFGTAMPVSATWPARLAEDWRQSQAQPVSVINAAIPGSTVRQMTYAYERKWRNWKPAAVAIMVTANMVSLGWVQRDREPGMPPLANAAPPDAPGRLAKWSRQVDLWSIRLCLPRYLSVQSQRGLYLLGLIHHDPNVKAPVGPMLAYGWRGNTVPAGAAEEAWSQLEQDLAALRDAVARDGGTLIVGFSPTRFAAWDSLRDNEKWVPRRKLTVDAAANCRRIARQLDVTFIDGEAALRQRRQALESASHRNVPLFICFDFNHLDTEGHGALAKAVLSSLTSGQVSQHHAAEVTLP
ncbi:MAG: hypothetical protein IT440_00410 [Phycisphaeraceae bacterium]|nr:hypothetical protein [Phycisphaeraceae bacterium]